MYQSPYLSLNGAVGLIARRLAELHPIEYPDEASAIDNARRQLLRALFDGAVYSRGVLWSGPPPADDPDAPPPLPEPIKWEQIEPGWWSHERYDQYVDRYRQTGLELGLLSPEKLSDKETRQPELIEHIVEGSFLLDKIIVHWNNNSFVVGWFDEEYVYSRIQVSREDIKIHFGVETTEIHSIELVPPTDAALPVKRGSPKRGRRPADVRTSVYEWLDGQPEQWQPCSRKYTETAHCYCTEVIKPKDELALRKCVDTIRKQVKTWCRERHSTKP
jgi:hypothetical protein